MKSKIWVLGIVCCLTVSFVGCKSKQSAYKAAYEKAQEKETTTPSRPVTVEETTPISKPKSTTTNVDVQQEKLTTVSGTGLRRYNVVIGSFMNKTNALSLKERMEARGYNVILAQNPKQMYRVIVASYDDKYSAVLKRDDVKRNYAPDFQDSWILEQMY